MRGRPLLMTKQNVSEFSVSFLNNANYNTRKHNFTEHVNKSSDQAFLLCQTESTLINEFSL